MAGFPEISMYAYRRLEDWINQRMMAGYDKPTVREMIHTASLYRECFCSNASFALRPTIVYSGRPEFAVVATKHIRRGTLLTGLRGLLIPLQGGLHGFKAEAERSMVTIGSGGSVAHLGGPISRVNHDCLNPGARFQQCSEKALGFSKLHVEAVRDIEPGEEITVHYGPDYFGPSNSDCLCAGCEMQHRNGWYAPTASPGVLTIGRTRAAAKKAARMLHRNRRYTYNPLILAPGPRVPGDYSQALAVLAFEECIAPHCRMRFVDKVLHGGLCICCKEQLNASSREASNTLPAPENAED
ncbi:hypothetical protein GQ44DRAFT_777657 [Phaeosphaeriaceae sp. PMI808]|nr:hypothetical protein GQ44DRAFT_777985 [Phaeosphaeriaceae sp. PMI808]KAH8707005.1 hypothetical protein GQ44DRAFT_777657 [Phaeosphaeriaceae sp. PMI808]